MKKLTILFHGAVKNCAMLAVLLLLLPAVSLAQTAQPETLTNASVISMKKVNLSAGIIKSKINSTPCNFNTDITALAQLKTAGVDDDIIEMMVNKSSTANSPSSSSAAPATFAPSEQWGTFPDKMTYISKNGKGRVFRVGETVRLGNGTLPQAFKYVKVWLGNILKTMPNSNLSTDFNNAEFKITSIKGSSLNDAKLIVKKGMISYVIEIESALDENAKEVSLE
ncbi:MAG: hypothetical protein V4478_03575 [Patescibacteria group bacterium]